MIELIALGICILGMLGAFYLGSRKNQDRTFELPKNYDISEGDLDMPVEPTEEEYQKAIKTWKLYGEEPNTESETG